MAAIGWARTRVAVPLDRSDRAFVAEIAGDGRTRLHIRPEQASAVGPPRGALAYPARWSAGRWSGEAMVAASPQWSWGYELEVAASSPRSLIGRILWSRRRLERLSAGLAGSLRESAERSARTAQAEPPGIKRRVPSASATATSRWLFVSATNSSYR